MLENALLETPSAYSEVRARTKLIHRHVGCPVEMLAGPDDLIADQGFFYFVRAGDGRDEPTAVVDFEKNGPWGIPISMLFIPEVDAIHHETDAFIFCGPSPRERQLMCISFQLACKRRTGRHDAAQQQFINKESSQKERPADCSSPQTDLGRRLLASASRVAKPHLSA